MAMQPRTYSLSGLEVELGMDRRTLARRLADVPAATSTGGVKRWRMRDVLRALNEAPAQAATPAPPAADQVAAFEVDFRDDAVQVSWQELTQLLEIDDDELREWIRYGCPYLERGGPRTRRGWSFSPAHVARWCGLWCNYLSARNLLSASSLRPGEATRRLRAGEPAL